MAKKRKKQTGPPGTPLEVSQATRSAAQYNANFQTHGGGSTYGDYEVRSRQEWAGLKRVHSEDTGAIWSSDKRAKATPGGMAIRHKIWGL
jgi:hypothetical protein